MAETMTKSRKTLFLIICLFALQAVALAKQPLNISDLKQQIIDYKLSGAYDRDIAAIIKKLEAMSSDAHQLCEKRRSSSISMRLLSRTGNRPRQMTSAE